MLYDYFTVSAWLNANHYFSKTNNADFSLLKFENLNYVQLIVLQQSGFPMIIVGC